MYYWSLRLVLSTFWFLLRDNTNISSANWYMCGLWIDGNLWILDFVLIWKAPLNFNICSLVGLFAWINFIARLLCLSNYTLGFIHRATFFWALVSEKRKSIKGFLLPGLLLNTFMNCLVIWNVSRCVEYEFMRAYELIVLFYCWKNR